jgi:antirestriction protein ArdC
MREGSGNGTTPAGRVRKGAKAVRILAPRTRKVREQDAETGEDRERTLTVGFVGVPVFRIEDTEGAPLEPVDYRPATFPPLFEVAERLGVDVAWAAFVARFRGYYSPGDDRILLCSHDERTFLHELAHAAHRRVLESRGATLKGGQDPAQEIVAEVVAATLCKLLDLDGYLPHSRDYVASYAGKGGPARAAMRVLADVQAVLLLLLEGDAEAAPVRADAEGLVAA